MGNKSCIITPGPLKCFNTVIFRPDDGAQVKELLKNQYRGAYILFMNIDAYSPGTTSDTIITFKNLYPYNQLTMTAASVPSRTLFIGHTLEGNEEITIEVPATHREQVYSLVGYEKGTY